MTIELTARVDERRLARPFRTSVITRERVELLCVEAHQDGLVGRGESFVHERSGTDLPSELARLRALQFDSNGRLLSPEGSAATSWHPEGPAWSASPAFDALDQALVDLRCKREGVRAWTLLGRPAPASVSTLMTVGADALEGLEARAAELRGFSTLKIKAGARDVLERVRAVRAGHASARLVIDGNEAWTPDEYLTLAPRLAAAGIALLEQPMRAGDDAVLERERPLPICADESFYGDMDDVARRYDVVNIKLPKAGGLRPALAQIDAARERGLGVFIGCMVCTSRAIAPTWLAAQQADFVDLDGPLHLAEDVPHAMRYEGELLHEPAPELWG